MKKLFCFYEVLVIACMALFSCCVNKIPEKKDDKIETVKMYNLGPDIFSDDIDKFSLDSITGIKINDNIIYFLPPIISRRNNMLIYDSTTANQVFIYKEHDKYGYYYDSLRSGKLKKASVDSFISMYTTAYKNPFSKNDSLVSSIEVSNHVTIEKYIPKKRETNGYDTLFVTYDNLLKDSYFTLSKAGDISKNKKLSRFGYFLKETESRKEKLYYWEMKKDVDPDKKVLEDFIKSHNDRLIERKE